MARRKNVKRIDPRYFLEETTHRDDPDRLDEDLSFGGLFGDSRKAKLLKKHIAQNSASVERDGGLTDEGEYYDLKGDYYADAVISYISKKELDLLDHEEMGATDEEKEAYEATFGGGSARSAKKYKQKSAAQTANRASRRERAKELQAKIAKWGEDIDNVSGEARHDQFRRAKEDRRTAVLYRDYFSKAATAIKRLMVAAEQGEEQAERHLPSDPEARAEEYLKMSKQMDNIAREAEMKLGRDEFMGDKYVPEPGEDVFHKGSGSGPYRKSRMRSVRESQLKQIIKEALEKKLR